MANIIPSANVGDSGSSGKLDWANLIPQILEKFIAVLEGAAIIAGGLILMRFVRSYLRKIEVKYEQQRNAINLLEKITAGFIIVISFTLALKIVGIDMTLLVSVGILGLSYGLQDVIKNYVAGILILFKSPFKIGQTVKIRNYTGKVHKIDFQSTTLETFDHRFITIYNSDVMTQSIINFSDHNMRRIDIDVRLGYGSDTSKALKIFERILQGHNEVLKNPLYSITFKNFTDTAAVFTVKFWVQFPCNLLKVRSEVALQINQAFDEEKIVMPYGKSIQTESDYTLADGRKERLKNFYSQPIFGEAIVSEVPQISGSNSQLSTGEVKSISAGNIEPGTETSTEGVQNQASADQIAPDQGTEGQAPQEPAIETQPTVQSETDQLLPSYIDAEEPE